MDRAPSRSAERGFEGGGRMTQSCSGRTKRRSAFASSLPTGDEHQFSGSGVKDLGHIAAGR
jgi:hypothetical protein